MWSANDERRCVVFILFFFSAPSEVTIFGRGEIGTLFKYRPSLCYTDAIHAVVPDSSKQTLSSLLAEDDYDALLSPLDRTKQPQQKPEVRVRFRLMDLFHKKS